MTRFLINDDETRSRCELKRSGGYEYARHPSTQLLCISWRLGTKLELAKQLKSGEPAKVWSPFISGAHGELIHAFEDPDVTLVAQNAFFERMIAQFVLAPMMPSHPYLAKIPIDRWMCTAAMAGACALPRRLEHICQALGLPFQKDMEGHRLMLKMSKPRRETLHDKRPWHNKMSDLKRVMAYCQGDVDATTAVFLRLPELNPTERKVWCLDQKINQRGFYVDRPLVGSALKLIDEEQTRLKKEVVRITGGEISSVNKVAALKEWLAVRGCVLPNLRKDTIRDALEANLASGLCREMLLLRQAAAKSSTKKYQAFELRSRTDSRVRDILAYHRAHTGRWGGVGVQPQNLPASKIRDVETLSEVVTSGDLSSVRMLYGNPMDAFSGCLRSVITSSPGKTLRCADYAAIEARVLFWVANHVDGLAAFRDGRPLYEEMAAEIYNKPVEEILNPSVERDVGKSTFLGSGFQMGPDRFITNSKEKAGLIIDPELAKRAIKAYRTKHKPVVKLWYALEKAAIIAVRDKKRVTVSRTTWWVEGGFLWCLLPSGRRVAYYGPKIKYETPKWSEEKRPVLYYWQEPKPGKWRFAGTYGGKLTENVVQAIARDLMAHAMLAHDAAGFDILLTAHDEELAENGTLEEFTRIMAENPPWAEGLPIKVAGWEGPRYKKAVA